MIVVFNASPSPSLKWPDYDFLLHLEPRFLCSLIIYTFFCMEKAARAYLQELVKPMLARIESLQRTNEELKLQVRHLESLVNHQKSYQKPTQSASQHMRDSRVSQRSNEHSHEKRPGWNSKTKVEHSPAGHREAQGSHQKVKVKPPIPKAVRSPGKPEQPEAKSPVSDKKIMGGTKMGGSRVRVDVLPAESVRGSRQVGAEEEQGNKEGSSKFEQLLRTNNELMGEMRVKGPNLVEKAPAPKSEYDKSKTTSSNERSFVSEGVVATGNTTQ